MFGPAAHVQPQAPWTTNWNNTLSMSSSALELMGDGDLRATAGTVVAFMAMQDIFRGTPTVLRESTAALVANWWTQQIAGDVVIALVGTDTRKFVKMVSGG